MTPILIRFALATTLLFLVGSIRADTPCPCQPGPIVPAFYRPNPRAVWDLYAVGHDGHFRPRVIAAPQPFYPVDGRPYYYLPISGRDVKPVTP